MDIDESKDYPKLEAAKEIVKHMQRVYTICVTVTRSSVSLHLILCRKHAENIANLKDNLYVTRHCPVGACNRKSSGSAAVHGSCG